MATNSRINFENKSVTYSYICSIITKPKRMNTDEKLDLILSRLDSMDKKIDSIEKRMDSMEKRMDSIENKIEGIQHEVSLVKYDVKKIFIELEKINTVFSYREMTKNQELIGV